MQKKITPENAVQKALINFFLREPGKFYSFKQINKKFGQRFRKNELFDAVHALIDSGFLESRGSQFRYIVHEEKISGEQPVPSGNTLQGVVDMTASGTAYIISPQSEQDIFISEKNLSNALDGDTVEVRIIKAKKRKLEGAILRVVKRARVVFSGIIHRIGNQFYFSPDVKNMNVDFIIHPSKLDKATPNDRVIVKFLEWEAGTANPMGEVTEVLGTVGENETEMKSILLENGFHLEFPKEVIQEAEALPVKIENDEIIARRDFRDTPVFTIDPEDAKDFDDALSFLSLEENLFEVGVHIADVSHYIIQNTTLDQEAFARATSVYLVDRAVPMIPEKLSNGICSLSADEDKLCFSVVWQMNAEGKIFQEWIGKSVIRSKQRFTYDQAKEIIDGKEHFLKNELQSLNRLAQHFRKQRFNHGAINFETTEIKFRLNEKAEPVGVFIKERHEAHFLVEEFMLLANKRIAEFIGKRSERPIPFVYRIHDLPDDEKLQQFAELAAQFGYKVNFSTPKHTSKTFNRMMQELSGKPEQYMLESLAIRTMAKAIYSSKNIGHYGLAFDFYTHFTSPIRRYPDLMVHRIVYRYLQHEQVHEKNIEARCEHCSEMEKSAADAERASVKMKQVEFMQHHVGETFKGIISGLTEWGMFVMTKESYCEGLIRVNTIRGDHFIFEEKKHQLRGVNSSRKFRMGDEVTVKLIDTNLLKRTIDFILVETENDTD